jgi:hypothetical protein
VLWLEAESLEGLRSLDGLQDLDENEMSGLRTGLIWRGWGLGAGIGNGLVRTTKWYKCIWNFLLPPSMDGWVY